MGLPVPSNKAARTVLTRAAAVKPVAPMSDEAEPAAWGKGEMARAVAVGATSAAPKSRRLATAIPPKN